MGCFYSFCSAFVFGVHLSLCVHVCGSKSELERRGGPMLYMCLSVCCALLSLRFPSLPLLFLFVIYLHKAVSRILSPFGHVFRLPSPQGLLTSFSLAP